MQTSLAPGHPLAGRLTEGLYLPTGDDAVKVIGRPWVCDVLEMLHPYPETSGSLMSDLLSEVNYSKLQTYVTIIEDHGGP